MFKSLDVVYYCVENDKWELSKDFYLNKLKLKKHFGSDEIGWLEFKVSQDQTTAIAISLLPEGEKVGINGGATAVFEVENIEKTMDEFKDFGIELVGEVYTDEMIKLVKFKDPNGNLLQIVQVLK